ncbi:MAG: spermidine/putrescine ABC transporter permease [Armatimonadetes bacterium CG_4_10_14_0_8_um_filter_66_14]|nr:sugar ABC transporter permease [Armatimonadota bacterium]OIP03958.1 MAG: spermidine/putrescine ABC transporter permease [Armatimonadetes bacterium CG2_30_66_41]PIU94204.1 MAG: spermidine/putrescine ABC transporter permease [Armatimonadetes bacterium CG06_land_8_20_14_3_00_66_21]PIZ46988.1 MAG: spermidine/putrescine ABC transporter permease [Armatimonadetes bacterium CG_4_10_14_0_8_um_filter_66_14]PJB61078.1 MAG: spermidine/putrescine ABC transporter permease [Armatimonadetes bacterium CG_4_9
MTRQEKRTLRNGLGFVSPWFVGLSVFLLYPIIASFYFSLCEYSVLMKPQFIGLGNYADLFTDEVFWKALGNTLGYAAFALPLGVVVSLGLAILLNTGVRGMTVYRTIFFVPSLVPMVALAILWLWIFNGEHGVLNHVLGLIGIKGPGWLSDPFWAKPALVLLTLWGVGHAVVIYLAGLQSAPQQLYEAAELDGANWGQKVRHVTLPMVSPVILFNTIMGLIGVFQFFAVPYVMSPRGQPARSTYFFAMYLYDNAFSYLRMGYASAMAWIMFLIILVLTLLALKFSERLVYYEGG